jgi:hypothetical protein
MPWSTRSFVLGLLVGAAVGTVATWALRSPLPNAFARLTGYTVEQGTVVTRTRLAIVQDGVRVGVLEKGVRLDLKGNTDKVTRFTAEIAWPETGPRGETFAPAEKGPSAFLEIQKLE